MAENTVDDFKIKIDKENRATLFINGRELPGTFNIEIRYSSFHSPQLRIELVPHRLTIEKEGEVLAQ